MAVYALLNVFAAWNELIGGLGMGTLIIRDVARLTADGDHHYVKKLISSVMLYRLSAMFLVSCAWFVFSPEIAQYAFKSDEYVNLIRFISLISFCMSLRAVLNSIQVATQHFSARAAINTTTSLLQQSLSVVGFLNFGVYGFFTGFLIATLVGSVLIIVDIRQFLRMQFIPFIEIFKKSRPYLLLGFLEGALDKIDRPVIAIFLGAESLAAYHIAKRLFENLYQASQAIIVPFGVKFGEALVASEKALERYYQQTMVMTMQVFIPMGFFVILTSRPLLHLYGGEKYLFSWPVVSAFGLTLMAVALKSMLRGVALRLLKPRFLMYQVIISYVICLFFYAVSLPKLGAIGIPIAMFLGYSGGIVPILFQLKKERAFTIPFRQFFISLSCGLSLLVGALPMSLLPNSVYQLTISTITSGIIYLSWIHLIGPKEFDVQLRILYSKLPLLHIFKNKTEV